jgi:Flp pilus assembly protein TadD
MKIKSISRFLPVIVGVVFLAAGAGAAPVGGSKVVDPRLVGMNDAQLIKQLRMTSPSSAQFGVLFARAQNNQLMSSLYNYLNQQALNNPGDVYARIWLANAAAVVANQGLQNTTMAPGAIPTLDQQHQAIGANEQASTQLQQAKQLLQAAASMQPGNALAQSSLGWFLVQQYNAIPGLQTEGYLRLHRAVTLAPGDALLWYNLGSAYLLPDPHGALPDRLHLAEVALKQATKLDKTFAAPHLLLRVIYTRMNEPKLAAEEAKAAAELLPVPAGQ